MPSSLKLFHGFSRDTAADFTGLRPGEIDWLRNQRIVAPTKRGGAYMYSFTDLLVLRLVRQLKRNHVPVRNIKKAADYLKTINPDRSLTNLTLYVHRDTGTILYIGEQPQPGALVNMSRAGQLMAKNLLVILPIGKDLEQVRKDVRSLDRDLSERLKSPQLVPLEEGLRKYGLA